MAANYVNEKADALFLSDSIGKHVLPIYQTDILFFRAAPLEPLVTNSLRRSQYN